MNKEKVPTGISGLDEMLGGGLPKGHTVAVMGSCGTGKTSFALQFLMEGLKQGDNGIFISLEDEKGLVDAAIFEDTYQRYGGVLYDSPVLLVEGKLSRQGKLDISIIASKITPLGGWDDLKHAAETEQARDVKLTFPAKNGGR